MTKNTIPTEKEQAMLADHLPCYECKACMQEISKMKERIAALESLLPNLALNVGKNPSSSTRKPVRHFKNQEKIDQARKKACAMFSAQKNKAMAAKEQSDNMS